MKRPTHRDIARLANVSHVTVSLALRGHRSIPQTTRDRIEKIAKQIGYRPDPALQALMIYRRGAKPSSYQDTVAWINNYRSSPEKLKQEFSKYLLGAQQRCTELGYQLEEFRMTDLDMSFERLSKILRARNIQGILFPPQDRVRHISASSFDWSNYFVVAFGFSLYAPLLDVVTNAQFRSGRLAVRKLRSLGYRRIGFAIERLFNERTDQNFLGAFMVEQRRFPASERLPVHIIANESEAKSEGSFVKWFSKHEPEVIIFPSRGTEWLRKISPEKRRGCGYAIMDVPDTDRETSGVNQNNLIIGRTAIDTLIAKIHTNDRGIPSNPKRILVEGKWFMGTSAPRIRGPEVHRS